MMLALAGVAFAEELEGEIGIELEPGPVAPASPSVAPPPVVAPADGRRVILALRTAARDVPYRLALPAGYAPGARPMLVLLDPHATSQRHLAAVESPALAPWTIVAPLVDSGVAAALPEVLADVKERFALTGKPAVLCGFGAAATEAYAIAAGGGFDAVVADAGILSGAPAIGAALKAAGVTRAALLSANDDITAKTASRALDAAALGLAGLTVRLFTYDGHHAMAPAAIHAAALAWVLAPAP